MSNALSYTLPDFDIHLIYNYRLSWAELSLLTNIAINYQSIDPNKSILYFSKILDYCGLNSFDICFTATFLSPVLTFLHKFVHRQTFLQIIRFILRKIF